MERSKDGKGRVKEYILINELLYKRTIGGDQVIDLLYVPQSMRKLIAIRYHDLYSHFGVDKTTCKILEHYYFPRLRRYVKMHIRNCIECIMSKNELGKKDGQLHPIPPGKRAFQIVNCNHLEPFPTTPCGNQYVIGFIDNLTKFASLKAVRNVSALNTVKKSREFVEFFGALEWLITDRGTCFTSELFQ